MIRRNDSRRRRGTARGRNSAWHVVAASAALLLLVGAAVDKQVPQLVWQRIGPSDPSLQASEQGLTAATLTRDRIGDDDVAIAVPGNPNGTLVVFFHGYMGDVDEMLTGPQHAGLRDSLLDSGYSIASSDGAGNGWGNSASVASYDALVEWSGEQGDFERTAFLAQSMGGLASLRMTESHSDLSAWIGLFPVCNLASLRETVPAAPAEDGQATASLSPVSALANTGGLPMMFFHSRNDTMVPKEQNTDLCATQARAAGAAVTVVDTFGDHGNQSAFQPDRVVEFLDAAQ